MKSIKRLTASTLSFLIVMLSPGLGCYEVMAQQLTGPAGLGAMPEFNGRAGAPIGAQTGPSAPGARVLLSPVSLKTSLGGPGSVRVQAKPGVVAVSMAAPAVVAGPTPIIPSQAAPKQEAPTFQQKVAAMGKQVAAVAAEKDSGKKASGLGRMFELSAPKTIPSLAAPADGTSAPESRETGLQKAQAAPAATAAPLPAPAKDERFDVGPAHRFAMKVMSGIWWVWDRAINSRWDKMPSMIGELYLYFNEQSLRGHVWDANALPTTKKAPAPASDAEKPYRSADGSNIDDHKPELGQAGTRFNQLREPAGPANPHFELMDPNPFVLSEQLMKRDRDAQGNPIIKEIPANSWFAGHIQHNVHDWENHEQLPLTQNPVSFTVPKGHPLAPQGGTVILNRTASDPTLPADYKGAAVHRNLESSSWDMSDLYGSSKEIQDQLRTFSGGHLRLGDDGRLPDDPTKPGVPLTGFNNNMSVPLAMLNIVWAKEHNFNADEIDAEYKAKRITLSDEELFQKARLRIAAVNAKIHTTEWTRWLFAGNKTLQAGMWHDWYGFIDKKAKLWVMRVSDRHPVLGKILGKLLRYELLFGIPGTATQHYGKNYNFVEEFPDVYRLHELIRDTYRMQKLSPNPDGTIEVSLVKPLNLRDLVGPKTQEALRAYPLEDWALTLGNEKIGELTINNFPDALRDLTAQDGVKNGHKVDLAAIDIIRTRERMEASTYVKFTARLGERPPRTFEELTGGNVEAAEKLRAAYKSVDQVDMQIGILAERKPVGFALGNRQFKVFVLSAPGRLKNDRFLSSEYGAKTYDQSGIEYIETTNFTNILARAFPSLKQIDIEAMENGYKPFAKPGDLQKELVASAVGASDKLRQFEKNSAVVNLALAAGTGILAAFGVVPASLVGLAAVVAVVPFALAKLAASRRSAAVEGMKNVEAHAAKTAERESLVTPLFKAEAQANKSARLSKLGSILTMDFAGMLAFHLWAAAPLAAVVLGGAAIAAGFMAYRQVGKVKGAFQLLRTGLYSKVMEDAKHIDPATLPGETSIQKRYWMLLGEKKTPVATLSDSYKALHASGLSAPTAFITSSLAHLILSSRTQKNMTTVEKARYGVRRFDLYVPNMIDAQDYSNTRTYMNRATAASKGRKPGDIDMEEFERIFREFGAGRGYVTAYDLSRMRDANQWRDAQAGLGNPFSRFFGRLNSKRRADQMIEILGDRVVWEDGLKGKLVPAVSREQMLRIYQGVGMLELIRQRKAAASGETSGDRLRAAAGIVAKYAWPFALGFVLGTMPFLAIVGAAPAAVALGALKWGYPLYSLLLGSAAAFPEISPLRTAASVLLLASCGMWAGLVPGIGLGIAAILLGAGAAMTPFMIGGAVIGALAGAVVGWRWRNDVFSRPRGPSKS